MSNLKEKIIAFNNLYRLPVEAEPVLMAKADERLRKFVLTIQDEISEGDEILAKYAVPEEVRISAAADILTDLSDWFCDLTVYTFSEAAKFGISLPEEFPAKNEPVLLPDGANYINTFKLLVSDLVGLGNVLADRVGEIPEEKTLQSIKVLLGGIVVNCQHGCFHFGLPMDQILDIIMDSNMSKLFEDGQPRYDERGKVIKGPNYWKPEPKIRELLLSSGKL